jgi:hypothetical protein
MTTLNTSAVQYGTLTATSFGTAFTAGMAAAMSGAVMIVTTVMGQIIAHVASTPIVPMVDIAPASAAITALQMQINNIKQGTPPIITVNPTAAFTLVSHVQQVIDAIKQKTPPPISADGSPAIKVTQEVQTAIDKIKQKNPVKIEADGSQALSEIKKVQSELSKLKDVKRTITYTYKTSGSPPKGAQHGWSGVVDQRRSITVGEYGKPEFVSITPLTNPNKISDKTIDLSRLSSAAPTNFQQGGNILAVNGLGNRDMMRELIEEIRDVKIAIKNQRMQSPPVIFDGKRVDEIQQQRRSRRAGDFA